MMFNQRVVGSNGFFSFPFRIQASGDSQHGLAHERTLAIIAGESLELGLRLRIFPFNEKTARTPQDSPGGRARLGIIRSHLQVFVGIFSASSASDGLRYRYVD